MWDDEGMRLRSGVFASCRSSSQTGSQQTHTDKRRRSTTPHACATFPPRALKDVRVPTVHHRLRAVRAAVPQRKPSKFEESITADVNLRGPSALRGCIYAL